MLLRAFRPRLPARVVVEISLDGTVLLFRAGVSLLAGIADGLVPALQATNPDVAPTLKDEGVGSGSRKRWNVRSALVVTQVAFSFLLLIGAGLFVRSLQKAQLIDPGFDTGPGAVVWPMPDFAGYETPEEVEAFYTAYEERLLSTPGVTGVAMADRLPLGSAVQTGGFILPRVPSETPDGDHDIDNTHINVGYFDAMGVEIVSGRGFSLADRAGDRVAIVSEAFVQRYYPGEDVLGLMLGAGGGSEVRIIGVAADTKVLTLGEDPRPYIYELQGQVTFFGMQVVVKGTGTSEQLVAAARTALDDVDPDMVLFEGIKTMDEHLSLLLFPPRMAALLLTVFGGLALVLAGIGIYGVVNYAVVKRTRELGIRMSLGATARDVMVMAVGGGMRLVLVGGVVGMGLAAVLTWSVSGYLFGISTTDLVTFATIPVLLSGVALVAAWLPARRASRVDPVRVLRTE
jgi:predicted permease